MNEFEAEKRAYLRLGMDKSCSTCLHAGKCPLFEENGEACSDFVWYL